MLGGVSLSQSYSLFGLSLSRSPAEGPARNNESERDCSGGELHISDVAFLCDPAPCARAGVVGRNWTGYVYTEKLIKV